MIRFYSKEFLKGKVLPSCFDRFNRLYFFSKNVKSQKLSAGWLTSFGVGDRRVKVKVQAFTPSAYLLLP